MVKNPQTGNRQASEQNEVYSAPLQTSTSTLTAMAREISLEK